MPHREPAEPVAPAGPSSQRADKWLWHARVVKTRALAADLVEAGKVRRNRDRMTKPADQIRTGDVLTITLPSRVRILKVTGHAERRGSPADAARLFEDLSPKPAPDEARAPWDDA